ncbi:uncharacterized protein BYT42DRAFT_558644 [Radiomyces spectabilis]|uniref:uncharacterized protein n=1 Tax=Radiomyces spectabilis TaxID=64574 RepID=UPI002220A03E|nr:uncharacterized protein BYT42DRAFT_558644 [Radiomyces spectabilis]KAI8388017.1 hypothetical protein BYT42DRAFT_558644 [Radiomyces spectabilis]
MSNTRIQQGIAKEHPEWVIPRICQQHAYKTGIYAAIAVGIVAFPIGRRIGLDRNRQFLAAFAASGVTGYITSQYMYHHCRDMYNFFETMNSETNRR